MSPTSGVKITAITEPVLHAEGPHWSQSEKRLLYVDTFNAVVYKWNYDTKVISSYKLEHHASVGVIIPVANESNQYIVCADRDIYKFKWEDDYTNLEHLNKVDEEKPYNQFNDGKADKNGRLWIGTLTRNKDLSVAPRGGSLFIISGKRLDSVEEKIVETTISNGLDWSHDSKSFYYIDSVHRTVVGYDCHEETGNITNKRIIFNLKCYPDVQGIPDGMTIDNEGNLWIALFGGSYILNVNPNSGKLIRKIKMPVSYITSACFGGPNLTTLYVTTSRLHLTDEEKKLEPLAGSVFAVENLGAQGTFINPVIL